MSYGTIGSISGGTSGARRVVVLGANTNERVATERLLRHQDYWTFATDDPHAAVRVTTVDAADVVLVDLGLEVLDAIPQGLRRRGDTSFPGVSPSLPGGYAVLRPLQADPGCARFPLVTLRPGSPADSDFPFCRFAFVDRVPAQADELLAGLETVWRDVVVPAGGQGGKAGNEATGRAHAAAEPATASPEAFASVPLPLRTALVVDPDPVSRRFVRTSLGRHGFTVHEATRSDEGFHRAVTRRPWLIITEMSLPDGSGLDLCRRARAHSLLRRTPIVFLAQRDDCDSRYLALEAGADDYVAKTVSEREMLIRLELLLKRVAESETPLGVRGLGLRGAVELVGTSAVLQVGHLGRLSGVLTAHRGSRIVCITFRQGEIVSAASDLGHGPEVVYDFIGWDRGLFEFHAGAPAEGPSFEADFNGLLLEGCRRLDERRRAAPSGEADPD